MKSPLLERASFESVCEMLSPSGTSALDRGQSAKSPARQFRKVLLLLYRSFFPYANFKNQPRSSAPRKQMRQAFLCFFALCRPKDDRRPSPGGTLSPQSADGTLLHSLGDSNAGRGVPPREVGTARRVCGATSPRRRAKARRRERGGVTEGRDAARLGWSAARRGNSTRSALAPTLPKIF